MRKNFTSFLLFVFAVLSANASFAAPYNKESDASFNANSDSVHAIEPPSANVNEQTNKPTSTYSNSQLWIKDQYSDKYYSHYLQNATAEKITISDKKNLKLDYFLNSYTANKTPFDGAGQAENTSSNIATDELADSSLAATSQTDSPPSPLAASLTSTDNDLKEYIDQELSSDDIVNPFSTDEEDSIFDYINLDDNNLLLLAKGLIGLLAFLTMFAIFKKIMQ